MMTYIFQATVLVGYFGLLFFTIFRAVEDEDWRWLVGSVVLLILLFAFAMKGMAEDEAEGPCLKKETSYTYNPATKTMMPYTKCVERGEWVK